MPQVALRFGGPHTELKLRVLTAYLESYLSVMKKQDFRLTYIDAFAGTGWSRAGYRDDERQTNLLTSSEATKGSALRVFDVRHGQRLFDRYVFNDLRKTAMRKLQAEIDGLFPDNAAKPEIQFSSETADNVIARECDTLKPAYRAVMFLDPFGMQVRWRSIERIAKSHQIDLWYLAPVGGAYGRLMQRNGDIPAARRRQLDEALGGSGWYDAIYRTLPPDLLGHTPSVRDPGWEAIAGYFMDRWRETFGPGALEATLPLGHPGRLPFLLCFAYQTFHPRPVAQPHRPRQRARRQPIARQKFLPQMLARMRRRR